VISVYFLHPPLFYQVRQGLKLKRVDRARSEYTWLLGLSEIRSSSGKGRLDDSTKARRDVERSSSLAVGSEYRQRKSKTWRVNEKERRRTNEDTRSPTWQFTPEIGADRVAASMKTVCRSRIVHNNFEITRIPKGKLFLLSPAQSCTIESWCSQTTVKTEHRNVFEALRMEIMERTSSNDGASQPLKRYKLLLCFSSNIIR